MTRHHAATATFLVAACALLNGCGDQTGPDQEATAPSLPSFEAATNLTLPKSYVFTLTSSCGERGLLGDYRVTVRDEQVRDVDNLNDDYPYQPMLAEVPTLQDLADLASSARPDEVVAYEVDEEGVPQSLNLDPVPNGIDDEECYEVANLVPPS